MSTTKTETEIVAALQRERDAIQASAAYYAAKLLEAQIAGSQWVKALMAAGDHKAGEPHDPRQVLIHDIYRQRQTLKGS